MSGQGNLPEPCVPPPGSVCPGGPPPLRFYDRFPSGHSLSGPPTHCRFDCLPQKILFGTLRRTVSSRLPDDLNLCESSPGLNPVETRHSILGPRIMNQ